MTKTPNKGFEGQVDKIGLNLLPRSLIEPILYSALTFYIAGLFGGVVASGLHPVLYTSHIMCYHRHSLCLQEEVDARLQPLFCCLLAVRMRCSLSAPSPLRSSI
ncbi:uncharacterized protein LOC120355471 isoform X2 [Nilaparvata lugens]|uniref:uncharacterized protein LOC120355471 isoform X2 n=1 Tax=Nilaparvata lugens TaxID=108931 RepID=UPI00193DB907|nr:uncharacterized protein LOC120355471 isoform X2 [Nilaparvata lugens]